MLQMRHKQSLCCRIKNAILSKRTIWKNKKPASNKFSAEENELSVAVKVQLINFILRPRLKSKSLTMATWSNLKFF